MGPGALQLHQVVEILPCDGHPTVVRADSTGTELPLHIDAASTTRWAVYIVQPVSAS